jgi:hypothetical protein
MNRKVDLPWQSTDKRGLETVMFRNITGLFEMAVCCAKPPYATVRSQYTAPFKEQALERDGIPRVAQDLGFSESMGYSWRAKRHQTGPSYEDQTLQ